MGRRATKPRSPSILGENTLAFRTERGWSQGRLAKEAGLSRSTIAAIELGKYPTSDMATVDALARAFGKSSDEMRAPRIDAAAARPFVVAFLDSEWRAAVGPTEKEIEWLNSLPEIVFQGVPPTPESIAELVRWRRDYRPSA